MEHTYKTVYTLYIQGKVVEHIDTDKSSDEEIHMIFTCDYIAKKYPATNWTEIMSDTSSNGHSAVLFNEDTHEAVCYNTTAVTFVTDLTDANGNPMMIGDIYKRRGSNDSDTYELLSDHKGMLYLRWYYPGPGYREYKDFNDPKQSLVSDLEFYRRRK